MHATPDAPQLWQEEVEHHMRKPDFRVSQLRPAIYWNGKTNMFVIAHVDDFFCAGPDAPLQWFRTELSHIGN